MTTVRIRVFTVPTEVGRTIGPAEARLSPRMVVDDDDRHVAGNYAAFVSTAFPERARDLPRRDTHPLSGAIVHTVLVSPGNSQKSFCDISL
jgi:hypothetical protein